MKKTFGIILTYNCAQFLPKTYSCIPKKFFDSIICVDDGSKDDIEAVAKNLGIPFYSHPHAGYGGNLKFALTKALELGADSMIELHGDGQFDFFSVEPALKKLAEGSDLVLGNRFFRFTEPLKHGMSQIRFWGNFLLSLLGRTVLWIGPPDLFTGFRGYSRRFVETIDFLNGSDDYFFSFEIIAQAKYAGLRIDHVPSRCYYTKKHTSMNLWKGFFEIFQTPHALLLYLLACVGIKRGIFTNQKPRCRRLA